MVSADPVRAVAGLAQRFFGRSPVSLSSDQVGDQIAQATLGWASFGLAPLLLSLQKPGKAHDPLLPLKQMERELRSGKFNERKFLAAEAEFARRRTRSPHLRGANPERDQFTIDTHHQIFGDVTARELLTQFTPKSLRHARDNKHRAQLLTNSPEKQARRRAFFANIPMPSVGPGFQAKQSTIDPVRIFGRHRTRSQTGNLIAPNVQDVVAVAVDATSPTTQPIIREDEDMSLTGVNTSIFADVVGGVGDAVNSIFTPSNVNAMNALANVVGAFTGNRGMGGPTTVQPMPISTQPTSNNPPPEWLRNTGAPSGTLPLTPAFGLPGVDIVNETTAGSMGDLMAPFRMTASGNAVAKPFAGVRPNGKIEWFIPAGQPKTWSKASVKRRRSCHPR